MDRNTNRAPMPASGPVVILKIHDANQTDRPTSGMGCQVLRLSQLQALADSGQDLLIYSTADVILEALSAAPTIT